jgi:hypothetical protein
MLTISVRRSTAMLTVLVLALTGLLVLREDAADAIDGPVPVVLVATGANYPDALAGSVLGAMQGVPILLVGKSLPLPDATVAALEALKPEEILVLGGAGAVGDDVVGALTAFATSNKVSRLFGPDRYATAAAIADALPSKVADADKLDGLDASAFVRAKTRTVHVSVDQVAFFPIYGSGYSWIDYDTNAVGRMGRKGSGTLVAPISLPDGARIVTVEFLFGDFGVEQSVTGSLIRRPTVTTHAYDPAESPVVVGTVTSSGDVGMQTVSSTDITDPVVDNSLNTYYVQASPSTTDWVNVSVKRAIVTLEIEEK